MGKLAEDAQGNKILPVYGDFTWHSHLNREAINEAGEDAGVFKMDFEFGFGLNGTCYNYQDVTAEFEVINISCKPKVFFSSDPQCTLKYNPISKSWSDKLTPATSTGKKDNGIDIMEICGTIEEG